MCNICWPKDIPGADKACKNHSLQCSHSKPPVMLPSADAGRGPRRLPHMPPPPLPLPPPGLRSYSRLAMPGWLPHAPHQCQDVQEAAVLPGTDFAAVLGKTFAGHRPSRRRGGSSQQRAHRAEVPIRGISVPLRFDQ